ncbi:MAG: cation-translocating P-type ATPase [Clostridiales bacterium]|nr:cation-translocating P-type ATPase [Clostridiales bacterium]
MFSQKSIRQSLNDLETDALTGLSSKEAKNRLLKYGKNQLQEAPKETNIQRFFDQLKDPLIFILLVSAVVSILLKEIGDACIILIVVLVNAIVGVVQEGKAQRALDALKELTTLHAIVRRDQKQIEIPADELVPGDIVLLETGGQIPADLRLISSSNLQIEESALTGESVPIQKDCEFTASSSLALADKKNLAFMTTTVTNGRGEGVVTATGMNTEIGKIAGFINHTPQELTPLQKKLGELGNILSVVAIALCVSLFGIAVFQHRNMFDMLITAISLAVAAVPEGLPAIVTIVLALGVSRMVTFHAIVRRLPCVETLGSVNVVCSDKTGTLTQNKMTVLRCYTNFTEKEAHHLDIENDHIFLESFVLCNNAVITPKLRSGDPTELALLDMARPYGIYRKSLELQMPRIDEKPFDSDRKMMTTLHKKGNTSVSYTKGASDVVLERCNYVLEHGKIIPMTAVHRKNIQEEISKLSSDALRVLASAMHFDTTALSEFDLVFIGLVGMIDPARPEAIHAVEQFTHACVKTVMITGDHKETAYAIANDLGIASHPSQCMTGQELNRLSDDEFYQKLPNLTVFARVSPEHKVRIVKGFQSLGNIVAMTGDGVNDAPSLRAADIGIAMGKSGTDVAKNASDMILTDDNFSTIEKAIEEGRCIYENIRKSVLFLLSSNFGEIITMFAAILFGLASPLRSIHILWINLITDSLPALALGVDQTNPKHLMSKPPRSPREGLFSNGGINCTIFYGILIASISLCAFLKLPLHYLHANNMPITLRNINASLQIPELLAHAQTYSFTVVGLSQLFHATGMRDIETSIFAVNPFSNRLMILSWIVGLFLQFIVTEIPYFVSIFGTVRLTAEEWIELLFLASVPLLAHEIFCLHMKYDNKQADKHFV